MEYITMAVKKIFLSTKLWATEYENENAVNETSERLGVDYVDLLFLKENILRSLRPNMANLRRGLLNISDKSKYIYSSGCWPSCSFHMHSVNFNSEKTALKEESSGEQA